LVFLVFALCLGVTTGLGAEPIIREIRVQGLESRDPETIISRLRSRVGEPLDRSLVQEDQRALLSMGQFDPESLRVYAEEIPGADEVILIFAVRENPQVSAIEIEGNVAVSTARIEGVIAQRAGDQLRSDATRQAREAVLDLLQRQGHGQARVRVDAAPSPDGSVVLRVRVDEGLSLVIDEVLLEGNEHFSRLRLSWQMKTRDSGLLGKNFWNERLFEEDLSRLEGYHFDRGFLDADVRAGRHEHSAEEGTISPVVIIDEGPRYRFGDFSVRGNTIFSDLEITSEFETLHGEWFSARELRERLVQVQNLYGDEGHINAIVEPRLDPDPRTGAVDVALSVREGPRVHVGAIYLQRTTLAPGKEGAPVSSALTRFFERISPPVEEEVVDRVITLEEGEVYRHYEEVRTADRLRRLGVFESVGIDRVATADPEVEDVRVVVDQQSTGFVSIGAGFGDETGLFGVLRLTENNFLGEADQIRTSIRVGTSVLDFNVTHFNRFLGETDRSLRLSAYAWELSRDEYDEDRSGALAEFGQPVGRDATFTYGSRVEYVGFDLDDDASKDTERAMESYVLALARLGLEDDVRDNAVWPTRGWRRSVGLESGWAGDWLVRLTGEVNQYHSLTENVILAVRLSGGLIPIDRDDVSFGERFFMGGSRDLRGFEFRGAGPVDSENDDLFIGGSTKVLSQVELRFPIWEQLRGVVFVDAGSLGEDPFELERVRASAGTGLRWTMPGFGSIAVDLAGAFSQGKDDDTQILQINFLTDF
jgi:outer membrane protein insertion porin family